jgi:hypothetical protein
MSRLPTFFRNFVTLGLRGDDMVGRLSRAAYALGAIGIFVFLNDKSSLAVSVGQWEFQPTRGALIGGLLVSLYLPFSAGIALGYSTPCQRQGC